jgi:uncharacterized alpha-E superfamily protein
MLSRTAANLFWTGRYMERADFVARLVEATMRLAGLASTYGGDLKDAWASALAACDLTDAYAALHPDASEASALHFLTLEGSNPGSLRSCIERARSNARAVRTAFSWETWEALNEGWHMVEAYGEADIPSAKVADLVQTTRHAVMAFDGSAHRTMVRSDAYWFLQVGAALERADNTARLLDQKYHLLLPGEEPVGGALDYFQWSAILRTLSGLPAYHLIYCDTVKPWLVADLLIFNEAIPRSLISSCREIQEGLDHLGDGAVAGMPAAQIATATIARLGATEIGEVVSSGLHEFLSGFVADNNRLGIALAEQFQFPDYL